MIRPAHLAGRIRTRATTRVAPTTIAGRTPALDAGGKGEKEMAGNVKAVPEGMHTITPHLVVRNAAKAIEFYKKAFGAEVKGVHYTPDGKVMHAMLKIGDSNLMMADEFPGMGNASPEALGGSPVVLNIYV